MLNKQEHFLLYLMFLHMFWSRFEDSSGIFMQRTTAFNYDHGKRIIQYYKYTDR